LLLLDEPTNHLDFSAIEWLEGLLKDFKGALLFITHDRRFLDNVANRIVELDRGQLREYQGNFTAYQAKKAEQLEIEAVHNRKFDKFWKQEEVWIRKGVQARRCRDEGRVRRLEPCALPARRHGPSGQVGSRSTRADRSGRWWRLVLVTYGYDDQFCSATFPAPLVPTSWVCSARTAGKSTRIRLILGGCSRSPASPPGSKRERLTSTSSATSRTTTHADRLVFTGSVLSKSAGRKEVISYLEDFLFPAERATRRGVGALRRRAQPAAAGAPVRPPGQPAGVATDLRPDIDTLEAAGAAAEESAAPCSSSRTTAPFSTTSVPSPIVFEGTAVDRDRRRLCRLADVASAARQGSAKHPQGPWPHRRPPSP